MEDLERTLRGKVCVLGVGNRLRGDDGAGSWLAGRIAGKIAAAVFDGGVAPENHLEKIAKARPDTILLVDAVEFGGRPGEVRLLRPADVAGGGLSTHALSLRMACEYLTRRTSADIFLAAIQPGSVRLAESMSEDVADAVEALADRLLEALPPR